MNRERRVFVDTSVHYAMADSGERNHVRAEAVSIALSLGGRIPCFTNYIRSESYTLIMKRIGRNQAIRFLDNLAAAPPESLIFVTEDDERAAIDLLHRYHDKNFSFVDATSFVVMERLGITDAFAYDEDFRRYGKFTVLQ